MKRITSSILLSAVLAVCLSYVSAKPASADYLPQSKWLISSNKTWSFSDDCRYSLAFWPDSISMDREWVALQPGQTLTFNADPAAVAQDLTCALISSSQEASGGTQRAAIIHADTNGDGTYETDLSLSETGWNFQLPVLAARNDPYRISAWWEPVSGVKVVNEYWVYVGNGGSVSINAGSLFTSSQQVKLNLSLLPGTASIQVSNDAGFGDGAQNVGRLSELDWQLSAPIDAKISKVVYVRFFNQDGGLVGTLSDDIILDSFAPLISKATVTKSSGQTSLVFSKSKKAKKVQLNVSAIDNISGLSKIQISIKKTLDFNSAIAFQAKTKITALPGATIFVRVQDAVGNWTAWKAVKTPK